MKRQSSTAATYARFCSTCRMSNNNNSNNNNNNCNEWVSVFLSECVLSLRGYSPVAPVRNSTSDMNEVMDQLSSRQVALELLDRRCVNDARRYKAAQNKSLFRSKMLEHRRFQAQMAQLQRYKESALTHMDAVSNHEINQTFMRAIQGTVSGMKVSSTDVTTVVLEDLQESLSNVKEISDLLGQPLTSVEEVTDEDLDTEFVEFTALNTITEAPPSCAPSDWLSPPQNIPVEPVVVVELRTSVFENFN